MLGDGPAFAAAIAAAHDTGGGRVVVPAGEWRTGPIQLKSNVELHLERGATIQFITEREAVSRSCSRAGKAWS